jgi:hypothetical protein
MHSVTKLRHPIEKERGRSFVLSDRIDRIIWILLLLSHLPDEGEKTQSALRELWLRCLRCWFSHCIALPFCMFEDGRSLDEGLSFLPFFRKGKEYLDYPVNPVSSKRMCPCVPLPMSLCIEAAG